MKFSDISNCVEYSIKPILSDSSFLCTKCSSNFYLNKQTDECEVRNTSPNCKVFNISADEC